MCVIMPIGNSFVKMPMLCHIIESCPAATVPSVTLVCTTTCPRLTTDLSRQRATMWSSLLLALVCWAALAAAQTDDSCSDEDTNFELVTGYVYSAPSDMLDSRAGTLMLAECIDMCRQNASCRAFNYETGLCVLIDSNADANQDEPGERGGVLMRSVGERASSPRLTRARGAP